VTALVANYVFSPLSGFWSSVDRYSQIVGYSRAAAGLARLGYHKEAKQCMLEITKLQNK